MVLYIYSMDSIVQEILNEASISRDLKKVDTLGPFAVVFSEILYYSNHNRTIFTGLNLFRATFLPDSKITQYKELQESSLPLSLQGYISTSTDEKLALKFLTSAQNFKHIVHSSYLVLYKIRWEVSHWNYMVNTGGF